MSSNKLENLLHLVGDLFELYDEAWILQTLNFSFFKVFIILRGSERDMKKN
jgi:hypothetical protein